MSSRNTAVAALRKLNGPGEAVAFMHHAVTMLQREFFAEDEWRQKLLVECDKMVADLMAHGVSEVEAVIRVMDAVTESLEKRYPHLWKKEFVPTEGQTRRT